MVRTVRTISSLLGLLGVLALGEGPVSALEPPATAEELTLRPGDTINWTPQANSQHRVRFGGTVTTPNGTTVTLTPFADVQKVLEEITQVFPDGKTAPLTADAQGVATPAQGGIKVTAKVKVPTATSGVTEFFFTCGFGPHTGRMVSVSFKVATARNVQIISAHDTPLRWVLQTIPGDPKGDRHLIRPGLGND